MSIQSEIDRIKGNVTAAMAKIAEKGVTVPDGSTSDALAELIASIEISGGGGNMTCGTITPLQPITVIEHSLGAVPNAFIWLVTFNETMSGRDMGTESMFRDEKAYSTKDLNIVNNYKGRMVCFVIGEYVYSLSYPINSDWGFFTRGSINTSKSNIYLNETEFSSMSLLPYSESGNATINWFAIGGA